SAELGAATEEKKTDGITPVVKVPGGHQAIPSVVSFPAQEKDLTILQVGIARLQEIDHLDARVLHEDDSGYPTVAARALVDAPHLLGAENLHCTSEGPKLYSNALRGRKHRAQRSVRPAAAARP